MVKSFIYITLYLVRHRDHYQQVDRKNLGVWEWGSIFLLQPWRHNRFGYLHKTGPFNALSWIEGLLMRPHPFLRSKWLWRLAGETEVIFSNRELERKKEFRREERGCLKVTGVDIITINISENKNKGKCHNEIYYCTTIIKVNKKFKII